MATIARTILKIKPGQWENMMEFGRSKNEEVSAIPGIISWGWAETGDKDEITLIVVYKDRDSAEAAVQIAGQILSELATFVAAQPDRVLLNAEWFTP